MLYYSMLKRVIQCKSMVSDFEVVFVRCGGSYDSDAVLGENHLDPQQAEAVECSMSVTRTGKSRYWPANNINRGSFFINRFISDSCTSARISAANPWIMAS